MFSCGEGVGGMLWMDAERLFVVVEWLPSGFGSSTRLIVHMLVTLVQRSLVRRPEERI